MSNKCQIVPALASAVHGVIDELALASENSSSERSHSTSSNNSSSNPLNGTSTNNATTSPTQHRHSVDARKAFAYFDKNHDGKLTIKEFQSVMQDLGYKDIDKCSIRQMFAEANRSGNSQTLSYEEFVDFLRSKHTPADEVHVLSLPNVSMDIETLFNCYDLDKNGYIEPKELRKVMKRLTGEKLSKRDIEEMINIADKNGDGLLDKSEFALLCSAF